MRNSLLEEAHYNGPVRSGLIAITQYAAGPLSHFLAARRREPVGFDGPNPFRELPIRYPRAWACLNALTDAFADGGRLAYKVPAAPMPDLPADHEVLGTTAARNHGRMSLFSGIDERFDQQAVDQLRQAMSGDFLLGTSALSRYSRNSAKLHRTLEFALAYRATILTTNYLIRPTEVWVRRGQLVKPISDDPGKGIGNIRGLSGVHRKLAETIAALR